MLDVKISIDGVTTTFPSAEEVLQGNVAVSLLNVSKAVKDSINGQLLVADRTQPIDIVEGNVRVVIQPQRGTGEDVETTPRQPIPTDGGWEPDNMA